VPADFQGKVALVTGVGRVGQIGHAVARGLGRGGAKLLLADVNAVGLADRVKEFAAEGIAAKASAGDLTTPEAGRSAVAAAHSHFGGLDIVVNVAGGFFSYGPFTEVTPDLLDREISVNFKTAFFVCQAAVPRLLERGGASIVNFASISAVRSLMHMTAYSAAKSAVAGLTRSLAREYRDAGLRVNAVAPATVRTALRSSTVRRRRPSE
jgi:NAD(P)-dependent dehydrogenase (short-subunit alcohol dehydrogenase family)